MLIIFLKKKTILLTSHTILLVFLILYGINLKNACKSMLRKKTQKGANMNNKFHIGIQQNVSMFLLYALKEPNVITTERHIMYTI